MEKKFQHFVPQFYLRNFSTNGKSVGTYIFSSHKYVENASIKEVCGRDYLYGEDLHIENWFHDLERTWSGIINKILSTGRLDINDETRAYLWTFFYLSDVRTGYAADSFIEDANMIVKAQAKLYRKHAGLKISDEEIETLRVTVDKPNLYYLQNLKHLVDMVGDLSIVLLHNTSSRQFITSDCPLVKYNQLFVAKNYFCSYGYRHIGIQCFLPISPEFCLVLYDDVVYECKNAKDFVIRINAPDQIIELNKLFVENGRKAIYFQNTEREWVITRMANKKADSSQKFNTGMFGNEKQGIIVMHSADSVHKKVKIPQFTIRPEFLTIELPSHAAGPLRPNAMAEKGEKRAMHMRPAITVPKKYPRI